MTTKGKRFIENFKNEIKNDEDINKYYTPHKESGKNLADYTKAMKALVKSVLVKINRCEFSTEKKTKTDNYYSFNPEYFKIDYTSWENTLIKPYSDTGIKLYDWNCDFAIEHENDKKDWTYELLKLSFVRADVRIVIGYVDREKCKDEIEVIKAQVKKFKHKVEDNEEYYVILMNTKLSENEDPFGMKVYSIKERTVEKIDV